jgi:hypothetical protein
MINGQFFDATVPDPPHVETRLLGLNVKRQIVGQRSLHDPMDPAALPYHRGLLTFWSQEHLQPLVPAASSISQQPLALRASTTTHGEAPTALQQRCQELRMAGPALSPRLRAMALRCGQ